MKNLLSDLASHTRLICHHDTEPLALIQPPPSTCCPKSQTTACPGATPNWGVSNSTAISLSITRTVAVRSDCCIEFGLRTLMFPQAESAIRPAFRLSANSNRRQSKRCIPILLCVRSRRCCCRFQYEPRNTVRPSRRRAPFAGRSCTPQYRDCLLYTSPSPRDLSTSRMPSSA